MPSKKKKKTEKSEVCENISLGHRTTVAAGDKYLVEEVIITAGENTHYIYHEKRHETWIPIEGENVMAIFGGLPTDLRVGSMVMVPRKMKHKIVNNGDTDFHMLVVQSGSDIVEASDIHEVPENTVPRRYKRGVEL
jgi:mannose-6-phosphate isomerase-like protein (cupin superfamily)